MSSGGNEEEVLRKLDLNVKEITRPNPLTIPADATVMRAAKAMEKHDSSCAFAKSRGKIVGMITERYITRQVVGKGASPRKTKVKSVMTSRVVVTPLDTSIEAALKVMTANKVRRLPVVDEKEDLLGLVGAAEIAKALAEKAGYTTSLITAMTKETLPPSGVYGQSKPVRRCGYGPDVEIISEALPKGTSALMMETDKVARPQRILNGATSRFHDDCQATRSGQHAKLRVSAR